ncbi:hypothetical protein [Tessaracoccus flavus]|uniref:Uncharacterized protein n=1 Tax=Tessaracoccus flavus TaxID=1610493 RepID=A0A1Q2CCB5_9ACTN|nr:hypothetical protein [Tessaracoccus flavus]AQP43737.1 hypothetical protein RPIT_02025 [Tessaracoccus flavus]SDY22364.1 hypothetical protein SAMN05428934_1012 [Tessaracoccus flavus]
MVRQDLADLIRERRIETVARDPEQVALLREQARAHLQSSRMIGHTDPAGAFSLAYDSIRKQLTALLLDHGFRAKSAGSHAATGQAAAKLLKGFDTDGFEWLRLVRNATAYGSDKQPPAGLADLEDAWEFASELDALLPPITSS